MTQEQRKDWLPGCNNVLNAVGGTPRPVEDEGKEKERGLEYIAANQRTVDETRLRIGRNRALRSQHSKPDINVNPKIHEKDCPKRDVKEIHSELLIPVIDPTKNRSGSHDVFLGYELTVATDNDGNKRRNPPTDDMIPFIHIPERFK